MALIKSEIQTASNGQRYFNFDSGLGIVSTGGSEIQTSVDGQRFLVTDVGLGITPPITTGVSSEIQVDANGQRYHVTDVGLGIVHGVTSGSRSEIQISPNGQRYLVTSSGLGIDSSLGTFNGVKSEIQSDPTGQKYYVSDLANPLNSLFTHIAVTGAEYNAGGYQLTFDRDMQVANGLITDGVLFRKNYVTTDLNIDDYFQLPCAVATPGQWECTDATIDTFAGEITIQSGGKALFEDLTISVGKTYDVTYRMLSGSGGDVSCGGTGNIGASLSISPEDLTVRITAGSSNQTIRIRPSAAAVVFSRMTVKEVTFDEENIVPASGVLTGDTVVYQVPFAVAAVAGDTVDVDFDVVTGALFEIDNPRVISGDKDFDLGCTPSGTTMRWDCSQADISGGIAILNQFSGAKITQLWRGLGDASSGTNPTQGFHKGSYTINVLQNDVDFQVRMWGGVDSVVGTGNLSGTIFGATVSIGQIADRTSIGTVEIHIDSLEMTLQAAKLRTMQVRLINNPSQGTYQASIYQGTKDTGTSELSEDLATGVTGVRVESIAGTGLVTIKIDDVIAFTVNDGDIWWAAVSGSKVSWSSENSGTIELGQGRVV